MKDIQFNFLKCEAGMIDFSIIASEQEYISSFLDTYDPFGEYVEWLEKILDGENNCTFYIDFDSNPGDDFAFNYNDDCFYVYRWGIDFNLPKDNKINRAIFIGDYKMKVNISREILVHEFYYSFRNFVESPDYNILEWESLRIEEYLDQTYGSIELALAELTILSLDKIFDKLNELNIYDEIFFKFPRNNDQILLLQSGDYEKYSMDEKIKYLKKNIFEEMITCCTGRYVLKELKSEKIENYYKTKLNCT
jgi:hypothetical protein